MGVGGGGGGVRRVSVTVQAPFALVAVEGQGTSEREDATFAICDVNATCPCALDPTYKTNIDELSCCGGRASHLHAASWALGNRLPSLRLRPEEGDWFCGVELGAWKHCLDVE